MTVTVPSSHPVHYYMQGEITNLTTQISAANTAGNYPLAAALTMQQNQKQAQLVQALIADGAITPATILANETYGTPNSSGQGMT